MLIISTIIILLSIPTQLGLLWQFYSNPPLSKISNEEIEALKFLKKQKGNRVLVAPFNKYERDRYKDPPIPIYAWYDTGYVSAFSGKQTIISDEEQVNIMGYDVNKLVEKRMEAFQSSDYRKMNDLLQEYNIDYIYLAWDQKIATELAFLNIEPIFMNKDAKVFKVKK